MVSFKGSVMNLSFPKRLLIWSLVYFLPAVSIVITVGLVQIVDWWAFLLIPDLMVMIIALSLSGMVLRGYSIDFLDGEIAYRKGWSRGRIPLRNLMKAYRVKKNNRESLYLVFNEPSSRNHPERLLTIEETFRREDVKDIYRELSRIAKATGMQLIAAASMKEIMSDRRAFNWVPA